MPSLTKLVVRALLAVLCLSLPATAKKAELPLVPLDDTTPEKELLPAGVSQHQPELFGQYCYTWSLDDIQVIQYQGDFSLHLGPRRLTSRNAVIWMQKKQWKETEYYHFEIVLSENAFVRNAAGTVTSGPTLFVTLNATRPPVANYDARSEESSADTRLYQEAKQLRESILEPAETQPSGPEVQVLPLEEAVQVPEPEAQTLITFRADDTEIDYANWRISCIGDVYVSRGLLDSANFMELQANEAVVFLSKPEEEPPAEQTEEDEFPEEEAFPEETEPSAPAGEPQVFDLETGTGARAEGVYLKGDVILRRGDWMIRASELYYDLKNDRALILDAVMRAFVPQREVPVYLRAEKIRQLSTRQYQATRANISASEFHTPHIAIGAEKIRLTDTTTRSPTGTVTGLLSGRYEIYDATLRMDGVPVAYWPYAAGNLRRTETSIRSVRTAYSDDFGATFQAQWYLFNLLGVQEPEGMETILRTDYFSERGPGFGVDSDYTFEDSYGLLRSYYIYDTGEDNLGPFRDGEFGSPNRYRATWRHRQLLGDGWELTLEGSSISDRNFLEEYFNAEFEEGKDQETLAYLKKQEDNWAFTALTQWRVMEWLTQTEHFPELAYYLVGEPLGEIASYFSEAHIGFARYKPDKSRLFNDWRARDNTEETNITFRAESRHELTFPFQLGPAKLAPFVVSRSGLWGGSQDGGSENRMFGSVGVRASSQFWRLFEDIESNLLDVHGVRHVIRPDLTAWGSASNLDSIEISPFSEGVETINDFYGVSLALRQRWETRRGGTGRKRTVDWITLDLEANFFGNEPTNMPRIGRFYEFRPENSLPRSHFRADFAYRISDTTVILSEANVDANDGSMDLFNVSYAVERSPRLSYFIGYRRIGDTNSDLLGAGTNYKISDKYTMAVRTYYDVEYSSLEKFDITFIRKFPRWYGALTLELDEIEDSYGIGVSAWPEGAPQAAIGTRKFTGLSESTAIRPQQ